MAPLKPKPHNLPLVVIVGPTACGKTKLAVDLARKHGGEIICADSRSIYRGMDIGTAKPTQAEQSAVPHWGIDLVEPGEYYSVADFKQYANQRIDDIRSRGHVPFLVGGTGLYIDAVTLDYQFCESVDNELRSKLQRMGIDELRSYCQNNDISLPENDKNKRYLIRAIEKNGVIPSKRSEPIENCIVVGISTEKDELRSRIEGRCEQLFNDGVIDEAKMLGDRYGWDNEAMKSNAYLVVRKYLDGDMSLDDAKSNLAIQDWHLAKRQITWFKRNKFIHWLSLDDAADYLNNQLANCT